MLSDVVWAHFSLFLPRLTVCCPNAAEGNDFGMTFLEFYQGLVLAMAQGKQVTFQTAKSKPRVRDGKSVHGGSARMKGLEASRKAMAIHQLLASNPPLAQKYSKSDCGVRVSICACRMRDLS